MAENLQNKIIEFNMMDQQLKQLEQKAMEIEKQVYEMQLSENSLEELKSKKDSEVMIPLAGGIFVKGKIEDAEKVIIHVGNRILARKSINDAKKLLEKQRKKVSDERLNIDAEMNSLLHEMTALEEQIRGSQMPKKHSHKHECDCGDAECDECK